MAHFTDLRNYAAAFALLLTACGPAPKTSMLLSKITPTPGQRPQKVVATPEAEPSPNPVVSSAPPRPNPTEPTGVLRPRPSPRPIDSPILRPPFPFPFPTRAPSPKASPKPVVMGPTPGLPPVPTIPGVPNGTLLDILTGQIAQAFGVYDNGWLKQADKLPATGNGMLKIFQPRNRGYGTLDMITLINAASKEIHRELPATELVQVGDISDSNGGQLGGHGSHQNGLDADIAYLKRNHRTMDPEIDSGFDEDFVDAKGQVTKNFDVEANWKLIQLLVSTGRIDRIFADYPIKARFCTYAIERGMRAEWTETLRKLRHWPNHQDHMHVRVTCPEKSTACKEIAPIPEGDGCNQLFEQDSYRTGGFSGTAGILLTPPKPALDEHGC